MGNTADREQWAASSAGLAHALESQLARGTDARESPPSPRGVGAALDLGRMRAASDAAAAATVLIDPFWGSMLKLVLTDVSPGQPIDVLLLGEEHTPPIRAVGRSQMTTLDFLQAAAYRAAYGATPRCCDIFIEHSAARRTAVGGRVRQQRADQFHVDSESCTINLIRKALLPCIPSAAGLGRKSEPCVLGDRQVRVHAFDTRVFSDHANHDHEEMLRDLRQSSDYALPASFVHQRVEWMRFFMGTDPHGRVTRAPFPHKMMTDFRDYYLRGRDDWLAAYLTLHSVVVDRVQRRAHKLGVDRAAHVAQLVVATWPAEYDTLLHVQAMASDFYLVLRMLAPNNLTANSPCRFDLEGGIVPRCCILYAGQAHSTHVREILLAMSGHRVPLVERGSDSVKSVRMSAIEVVGGRPVRTADELLRRLSLTVNNDGAAQQASPDVPLAPSVRPRPTRRPANPARTRVTSNRRSPQARARPRVTAVKRPSTRAAPKRSSARTPAKRSSARARPQRAVARTNRKRRSTGHK